MDDEQAQALKELRAQLKLGGRFKIITANAAPGRSVPSVDPADYVQHEATRLEGPSPEGLVIVYSDEGDAVVGQPAAVLRRLSEWRRSAEPG